MNWFTAIFSKDRVKKLTAIAISMLGLFLGKTGDQAWTMVQDGVWRAEQTGKPGTEKFEMVYGEVKQAIKDPRLYKWLLRSVIDIAVGVLQAQQGKLS